MRDPERKPTATTEHHEPGRKLISRASVSPFGALAGLWQGDGYRAEPGLSSDGALQVRCGSNPPAKARPSELCLPDARVSPIMPLCQATRFPFCRQQVRSHGFPNVPKFTGQMQFAPPFGLPNSFHLPRRKLPFLWKMAFQKLQQRGISHTVGHTYGPRWCLYLTIDQTGGERRSVSPVAGSCAGKGRTSFPPPCT